MRLVPHEIAAGGCDGRLSLLGLGWAGAPLSCQPHLCTHARTTPLLFVTLWQSRVLLSFLCVKQPIDDTVLHGMREVMRLAMSSLDRDDEQWVVVALHCLAKAMPQLFEGVDVSQVTAGANASSKALWGAVADQGVGSREGLVSAACWCGCGGEVALYLPSPCFLVFDPSWCQFGWTGKRA